MVVVVAATAWFAVLLMGLGYAVLLQLLGDAACSLDPSGSNYGELGWSVVPPGPTCTFTHELHGIDEVRGPTPVMSVWILVLVAGAVALVLAGLRTARSWNSSWRELDRAGPETELTPR